jgi:RND family efflux transporter MFP subunit
MADPDLSKLRIDRPRRDYERASGRPWGWIAVAALLLAALGWTQRGAVEGLLEGDTRPKVRLGVVRRDGPAPNEVAGMAANGYVVAARRAALSADTPGRIVQMNVTEGQRVRQGEVVARLYAEEYAAAVARARAEVAAARAEVARVAKATAAADSEVARATAGVETARAAVAAHQPVRTLAGQELARVEAMTARQAAVARDLDRARSERDAAEARASQLSIQVKEAQAALAQARARADLTRAEEGVARAGVARAEAAATQAEATLDKTLVRAPFDGIVVLKDAEVGEVVSPNVVGGGASSRGAIATLVDPASLEVQVEVPETSLKDVRMGGPVRVFLDAAPARPYAATVSRIWPTANRQKATVEVRARFAEPDGALRPDMGVRAVFLPEGAEAPDTDAPPPPRTVPEEAVVTRDGARGIFLYEEGRARFRRVEAGEPAQGRSPIEDDIETGTRVLLAPPRDLSDGDAVRVKEG